MAIYLGNTPIAENVTIQQGSGVTIDDTLSDTSKNPVQNKVINAALNNKAELTDIPTTLPANGGNADTSNYVRTMTLIGTNETYCAYSSILDWAANTSGGNAWAFVISTYGFPTDAPIQNCEAVVSLECDTSTSRKYIEWKQYGDASPKVYKRCVYGTNWHGDWFNVADGGNADTLDGKHASDFVDVNDTSTQIEIPSDTNNPIDVPSWIVNNGKRYTRYFTASSTGRTNVPNNSGTWVWYYFDGINIIAREFVTDNVWTATVINNQFTGWKLINSSNADTLNGRHSGRIATKDQNGAYFDDNAENINDAYLQWDGSTYFKLKTFGKNLTAVDYATNAATVNGLTVQTAVPANAKFTDTTYGNASASAPGLVSTGAQTFAGNKTFNGQVIPAGASAVGTAQARKIYAGTSDMTAGTTALETGAIYLVYE